MRYPHEEHPNTDPRIINLLNEILWEIRRLNYTLTKENQLIMADLTILTDAVTKETTVVASAITLIQQIADALKAATDPAAVQALADQLNTSADALAAAVTANTPAA